MPRAKSHIGPTSFRSRTGNVVRRLQFGEFATAASGETMFIPNGRHSWSSWAPVPLRLMVGYGFMAHGWAKWVSGPDEFAQVLQHIGVPLPQVAALAVALVELFGGLAILIGAFVALTSIPLVVSMLVAAITVQRHNGFSSVKTVGVTDTGLVFGPPGYEINLLYIAALVALAIGGAGPLSVDHWLEQRADRRSARTMGRAARLAT